MRNFNSLWKPKVTQKLTDLVSYKKTLGHHGEADDRYGLKQAVCSMLLIRRANCAACLCSIQD